MTDQTSTSAPEDSARRDRITQLAQQAYSPVAPGTPPLAGDTLQNLLYVLGPTWELVKGHHLEKKFTFPDFKTALAFTNNVGALAETMGHHPDIHLGWGKVRLVIWTHDAGGLTELDFVLAAKIEGIPRA
jgi:4a-hydroxytetrahydrobiopterin dehydratase